MKKREKSNVKIKQKKEHRKHNKDLSGKPSVDVLVREKTKSGKKRKSITGITKRWATNTLLITALVLLVLVASSILFIVEY